jgi:hypothetical protein
MSDCCFSGSHNHERPTPKREYVELEYVPLPDKILTAREYRAKLKRAKGSKGEPYSV